MSAPRILRRRWPLSSASAASRRASWSWTLQKRDGVREVAAGFESRLPILYERAVKPSAAMQRNQGAAQITMPVIAFMDDDITLHPGACERICEVFDNDESRRVGGVSARIEGSSHPAPRGLLWWYYRLQAGYADETYGARLFGPAINCFPCYERAAAGLIPADWLNSACVFYRTPVFLKEQFPAFEGYSYMEDVHLSARIAKTHRLFFHAGALCDHRDGGRGTRSNAREIARMRIRNQRRVAREVLDLLRARPRVEALPAENVFHHRHPAPPRAGLVGGDRRHMERMKIHGICLIKNEADIAAWFLGESSRWCDFIYVLDTGSTDRRGRSSRRPLAPRRKSSPSARRTSRSTINCAPISSMNTDAARRCRRLVVPARRRRNLYRPPA